MLNRIFAAGNKMSNSCQVVVPHGLVLPEQNGPETAQFLLVVPTWGAWDTAWYVFCNTILLKFSSPQHLSAPVMDERGWIS